MIKKLGECRNDFLSTLYGKLSEIKTCEKLVKKYLPEKIATHCRITDINNNTITITTTNTGILSLLRYEKSSLLNKLRTEEKMYALKTIELKMAQPHFRPIIQSTKTKPLIFSEKSTEYIHSAANHCSYSPLKKALERLEKTLKEKTNNI